MITARSARGASARTLPGQSCRTSGFDHVSARAARRPVIFARVKRRDNGRAAAGCRRAAARSGGSSISIVLSRNSRSWRKALSSASRSGDRLVAAITRTSIGTGRLAPTGRPRAARARSAAWAGGGAADCRSRRGTACRVGRLEPADALAGLAPVKAPLTWPNSSDSNRLSAVAPRSTETIGLSPRRDRRWISRATISLPVPFSPRIRTLASVGAARSISGATASLGLPSSGVSPACASSIARPRSAGRRACSRAAPPRCAPSRPAARCSTAWRRSRRAALDRLDRDRHGAMRGDDHHRRVGILGHDPAEPSRPSRRRSRRARN
jgi:hypothetical protein